MTLSVVFDRLARRALEQAIADGCVCSPRFVEVDEDNNVATVKHREGCPLWQAQS